jgi:hypothetical protein
MNTYKYHTCILCGLLNEKKHQVLLGKEWCFPEEEKKFSKDPRE